MMITPLLEAVSMAFTGGNKSQIKYVQPTMLASTISNSTKQQALVQRSKTLSSQACWALPLEPQTTILSRNRCLFHSKKQLRLLANRNCPLDFQRMRMRAASLTLAYLLDLTVKVLPLRFQSKKNPTIGISLSMASSGSTKQMIRMSTRYLQVKTTLSMPE